MILTNIFNQRNQVVILKKLLNKESMSNISKCLTGSLSLRLKGCIIRGKLRLDESIAN